METKSTNYVDLTRVYLRPSSQNPVSQEISIRQRYRQTTTDTVANRDSKPNLLRFSYRHIAKMASVFEPSLSTSRQGPPAVGLSAADSLPSINFGFDDLRDRMAKFTAKFDAFIEQGRKRVLEERNQFHMSVAELQGTNPSNTSQFGKRKTS